MASKTDPILTRSFSFLCLAQFLGYSHNGMLTPTLPLYVIHLGGSLPLADPQHHRRFHHGDLFPKHPLNDFNSLLFFHRQDYVVFHTLT